VGDTSFMSETYMKDGGHENYAVIAAYRTVEIAQCRRLRDYLRRGPGWLSMPSFRRAVVTYL